MSSSGGWESDVMVAVVSESVGVSVEVEASISLLERPRTGMFAADGRSLCEVMPQSFDKIVATADGS